MARFEMLEAGFGAMGATAQADILFELGMMYATGRDCETDVVAAQDEGSTSPPSRARCAPPKCARNCRPRCPRKVEIARALREAREIMKCTEISRLRWRSIEDRKARYQGRKDDQSR